MGHKYAIFDLDDTLHDKTAALKNCALSMFDKFLSNTQIERDGFCAFFVQQNTIIQPKTQAFASIAREFGISRDLERSLLETFDSDFHLYAQAFPNVAESLKYFQDKGVRTACLTNGRDFFQRNKIKALGFECYFDVILTSCEVGVKKPDLRIFSIALERLQATADQCIYIGDSLSADIQPAKALGMKTIWKVSQKAGKVPEADFQIDCFSDLPIAWDRLAS